MFSIEVQHHWDELVNRPTGEFELLIGSEVAAYHPRFHEAVEHLVVKRSPLFGCEFVFNGDHTLVSGEVTTFTEEVEASRLGFIVEMNRIGVSYTQTADVLEFKDPDVTTEESCSSLLEAASGCAALQRDSAEEHLDEGAVFPCIPLEMQQVVGTRPTCQVSANPPIIHKVNDYETLQNHFQNTCPYKPTHDFKCSYHHQSMLTSPDSDVSGTNLMEEVWTESEDLRVKKPEPRRSEGCSSLLDAAPGCAALQRDSAEGKKSPIKLPVNLVNKGGQVRGEVLNNLEDYVWSSQDFASWKKSEDREEPGDVKEHCSMISKEDFLKYEGMGCEPPRRCNNCKNCKECSFSASQVSAKEAWEYSKMEERVKYDPVAKKFRVKYFFLQDPSVLSNNYGQVFAIANRLERKLEKEGLTSQANKLFDKMIDLGVVEEITPELDKAWTGPKHYVSIQHVVNTASATTPLRLVTNSSVTDPRTGISLNSILPKGPKMLNDCWEVLLRFRSYDYGLISDISKAYYQMLTGELEFHVRRVMWRHGDKTQQWKIYGFRVVSMGDTPAACLLEIVITITVHMFGKTDLVAAHRLKWDRFVDDLTSGGTKEEVSRFKGEEKEDQKYTGTMPQILSNASLNLKAVVISGEPDGEKLQLLGAAALGLAFSSEEDTLAVSLRANVSPRKQGAPTGPDLTLATLPTVNKKILTKRLCMGLTNMQYDPVSLATPLTVRLKIGARKLFQEGLGWDDPLPTDLQDYWMTLIEMLVRAKAVKFHRCTKPKDAVGKYQIIAFWDGSDWAFACVIYKRWKKSNGKWFVRLLASKVKVGPMFSIGTPRMELNGAVLMIRLVLRYILSQEEKPEIVWFAGDSETILAAREKEGGFFGEYFGNRIGELWDLQQRIEEFCPVGLNGEWYHVAGQDNPADRPTRLDTNPEDIGTDSDWQKGPDYLADERENWPFNRNFAAQKKVKIPREEVAKKYRGAEDTEVFIILNPPTEVEESHLCPNLDSQVGVSAVEHDKQKRKPSDRMVIPARHTKCGNKSSCVACGHIGHHAPNLSTSSVEDIEMQDQEMADAASGCVVLTNSMDTKNCLKTQKKEFEKNSRKEENLVLEKYKYGYKTNSWKKLLQSTGFLFRWSQKIKMKTDPSVNTEAWLIDQATMFWMTSASPPTLVAQKTGKLANITPLEHPDYPGVLVVKGRAMTGMKTFFGKDHLVILMAETRVAYLITLWAHEQDHSGVDVTAQTTTQVAWIVGVKRLAQKIKNDCIRCKFLEKKLEGQKMASLPPSLTVPCPVFSHIGMDLAGPFIVTRERTATQTRGNPGTIKVWAAVFICLNTHAVRIEMIAGYSTQDFLLAWRSLQSEVGVPLSVHTDQGSQLVSAAKVTDSEKTENDHNFEWKEIAKASIGKTTWIFAPAGGQHRNGAAEALVKKFKRTLDHLHPGRKLSLLEMQVVMKEIAAIINARPIHARYGPKGGNDPDYLTPITPAMLLTGRTNSELPNVSYDTTTNPLKRLHYVSEVVENWWKQWKILCFSSLIPTKKWTEEKRSLREGDVVLLQQDTITKPGTYRLGIISEVEVDGDGLVRTVVATYSLIKQQKDMKAYTGITKKTTRVPVQKVVLILPKEDRDVELQVQDQELARSIASAWVRPGDLRATTIPRP